MSDAPQATYFLLTVGLSRGQDDATAKKKVCTWSRMYIRLEADGTWCAVNECEDGLMWFSDFALFPLPARSMPIPQREYEQAEKRYLAKAKAKREREAKEKSFRKQCQAGDIYGLHPERTKERIQRKEQEHTVQVLADAGTVQVYPEPTPQRSEASRVLVVEPVVEPVAQVVEAPAVVPAVAPAQDLLQDFTVIDTEFVQEGPHLLEVAAIRYQQGEPVGEYVSFVAFDGRVPSFVTELTGITSLHLYGAPSDKQVLGELRRYIGDSLLVCHNVPADRSVIEKVRTRLGATQPLANPWLCTMALARRLGKAGLLPQTLKFSLADLCHHFSIKRRGEHRAKADVLMTVQVLRKLHELQPVTKHDLHGAPQPGKKNKNVTPAGPGLFAAA